MSSGVRSIMKSMNKPRKSFQSSSALSRLLPSKAFGKRRKSAPVVRFNTYTSDGESLASSTPSMTLEEIENGLDEELGRLEELRDRASSDHHGDDEGEDGEDAECLRRLDQLGAALENTFRDVDTIDAVVSKLRSDFNQEMVSEQHYMSSIGSAKLARAACCKKQIATWKELQHELQEFCCSHCHHHQSEVACSPPSDCVATTTITGAALSTSPGSDSSHCEEDIDAVIHQLNRLSKFDLVKKRLDPSADAKSFVEHWIFQGHHCAATRKQATNN